MDNSRNKSYKIGKKSKTIKIVFFIFLIFIVSGVSSVFSERYFFPWLAARSWTGKFEFFKKGMENVMVINKTEQVNVNEDKTISNYTQKSASSVVEIVVREKGAPDLASNIQAFSGVVIAADGLVATYNGGAFDDSKNAQYRVFTQDSNSYEAQIVVKDSFSKLVILELSGAENLHVAEFIAPEDIKVGMKTAVIGNDGFNSEISLRLGIVSEIAKAFSIAGPLASSEKLQGVLFSDIEPTGRWDRALSGGAVVDYNGNLIGILGSKEEDADTKYFVVPVNHLQYVIDQYLGKGKIERATLGIYYVLLSKETAFSGVSNADHGALIYSPSLQQGLAVISGSAADKAGLKILDIIVSVAGDEVNPSQNLAYLISQHKPGETVNLKVLRDGKEMEVKVALQ